MEPNPILAEHVRRNRTTRDRRDAMASHRAQVMRLILAAAPAPAAPSLALLGVGNANDVDLPRLAGAFARIALVDLDDEALAHAVQRAPAACGCVLERVAPCDLTGLAPTLAAWRQGAPPTADEVRRTARQAAAAAPPPIDACDVVVSTCVLTQLIDSVLMAIPPDHPQLVELILAVRNRHLEIVAQLVAPGGVGAVVTDFVSTDTAPELARLDDAALSRAAVAWINQRNFLTGANPVAIRDFYQGLAARGPTIGDVKLADPWRWDNGARQFAVSAVVFRRRERP